jgi:hypothetical protein
LEDICKLAWDRTPTSRQQLTYPEADTCDKPALEEDTTYLCLYNNLMPYLQLNVQPGASLISAHSVAALTCTNQTTRETTKDLLTNQTTERQALIASTVQVLIAATMR